METSDFSQSYFSFEGGIPEKLPVRFRLPSGETRYCKKCLLDDIYLAGYSGPFEYPEVTSDYVVYWDFDSFTFKSRKKTEREITDGYKVNREVRAILTQLLKSVPDINLGAFDSVYKEAVASYTAKILYLLKQPEDTLLTYDDIPSAVSVPPNKQIYDEALAKSFINANFDRWKAQYETFGFIFHVPENVRLYFTIPSDWVKGSTPLDSETSFYFEYSLS